MVLVLMELFLYTWKDNKGEMVTIYRFSPTLVRGHFFNLVALTIVQLKKSSLR